MLIFCCGMVRSGSTLQYQLAGELVTATGTGKTLGWIPDREYPQLIAEYKHCDELAVVKCHNYSSEAGDLLLSGMAKAIYIYRDIRDVVVSRLNKSGRPFSSIVNSGFVEKALENELRWNAAGRVLCSRYEEMTADLILEVKRIARYLGLSIEDGSASRIAEKYSLEKQIERIRSFDYETDAVRSGRSQYHPDTLLHRNHIFSGKTGQWMTTLSGIQSAALENIAHEWLVNKGYPVRYGPAQRKAASMLYKLIRYAPYLDSFEKSRSTRPQQ